MTVFFLPMYESAANFYSDNLIATIDWVLKYDSHLIMEPGELAEYARGSILLLNSEAKLTIIEPEKKICIPWGDAAYIFFKPEVTEGFIGNDNKGFRKIRSITRRDH